MAAETVTRSAPKHSGSFDDARSRWLHKNELRCAYAVGIADTVVFEGRASNLDTAYRKAAHDDAMAWALYQLFALPGEAA